MTTPCRLELKNVKNARHLSRGTVAFTADLYMDGVRIAIAQNDGSGGASRLYDPTGKYEPAYHAAIEAAEAYAETLPPHPPCTEPGFEHDELDMDLDFWLGIEAERADEKKAMQRAQKNAVLFTLPTDAPDQTYRKATLRGVRKMTDAERARTEAWVLANHPDATIIRSV